MENISAEELKSCLPDKLKRNVSASVMSKVNEVLGDPEVYDTYRENLLGYAHVLQHGRFKMTNYIDAVKFVSYKLMGKTSKQSFLLVFPEKIANWDNNGVESKDQASYITAYNSSKLVNLVYEQSLIPVHVLNRDNYQRAINTQISLMLTAKSEMARVQAANSVLTHLKPPEQTQIDINIRSDSDSAIDALTASTQAMINQQKQMLSDGLLNAQDLAHQSLNVIEHDPDPDSDSEEPEEAEFTAIPAPEKSTDQNIFE